MKQTSHYCRPTAQRQKAAIAQYADSAPTPLRVTRRHCGPRIGPLYMRLRLAAAITSVFALPKHSSDHAKVLLSDDAFSLP